MNIETYRVIFLDFDGVLNSREYMKSRPAEHADFDDIDDVDPDAVARVQRIVDATDARIVISSTWRLLHELDELRDILKARGLTTGKVVAATPALHDKDRGDEIQRWLDMASIFTRRPEGIVILDDDSDMGGLLPWLVKTTFDKGLTDYHVTKAIEMLSKPHPPLFVNAPRQQTSNTTETK